MKVLANLGVVACLAAAGVMLAMSTLSFAADKTGGAKVGGKAPAFEGVDDQGKPWKSSDHVGKKVLVLYFYPADFTGGCTKQACGYRDNMEKLSGKDVEVIGISGDSAATHAAFKKHEKLNFTLLADENGGIAKKFGVPAKVAPGTAKGFDLEGKSVMVERGATIQRWTVIIDKSGNIADKYAVKDAGGDSQKVLQGVEKLTTK